MFFGAVIKPGKSHPLVPHADGHALHLSQASLAADVKTGTRASVLVKLGPKEEPVIMCTLCAGSQDTVLLDQFMTEYAELSVKGSVAVHITGYFSPEYGPADGDDEGKEDEDYGLVRSTDSAAAEPWRGLALWPSQMQQLGFAPHSHTHLQGLCMQQLGGQAYI